MSRFGQSAPVIAPLQTGLAGAVSGAVVGLLLPILVGLNSSFREPGITSIADAAGRTVLALVWLGPTAMVVMGLLFAGVALLVRGLNLRVRRTFLFPRFFLNFGLWSAFVTFLASYLLGARSVEQYVGTVLVFAAQLAVFGSTTRSRSVAAAPVR